MLRRNSIAASMRFSWLSREVISYDRTIELVETTIETSRMMPLKNVLSSVCTAEVSVRSCCNSKVQMVPAVRFVTKTSRSNATMTPYRFPSRRSQRFGWNPFLPTGSQ